MGKRTVQVIIFVTFLSTFLILLGGFAVISVGMWIWKHHSFMQRLLGTNLYLNCTYVLIAAGATLNISLLLVGFGSLKAGRLKLTLFHIILCAIFLLMLAGGVLSFVFRDKVGKVMYEEMLKTISLYQNDTSITDTWDAVQIYFQCCGVSVDNDDSYLIWRNNSYFDDNKNQIPSSCCKKRDTDFVEACQSDPKEYSFNRDCHGQVKISVKQHALTLGGLSIGTACVLVIGMMLSCTLDSMIE